MPPRPSPLSRPSAAARLIAALAVALAAPALALEPPRPPAEALVPAPVVTVLHNVRVHTLDADRPTAGALAWGPDGRLLEVGDAEALLARYPGERHLDGGGATVIPGLIDAHGHLMGLGDALMRADLMGADSKAEILARLQAFAADLPPGAWLLGRGWDQNRWPEAERDFPTAADLDAAFPDRPVWLERVDGHASWGNSAALRASTRALEGDWQPEGGRILRDAAGRPTGVFIDTAAQFIEAAVPAPDAAYREEALERALAAAAANGLTGLHDMGTRLEDLALYRRFADAGRLSLRVTGYADGDNAMLAALCAVGPWRHAGGRLRMNGVKLYADGALGSRGAALEADYHDAPGERGLLVTSPEALGVAMDKARDCGLQVAAHAIGDRGNRIVIDLFDERLDDANGARWRVEHAQVVEPALIPRFAQLAVIASMQPTHATSDMPWAGERLGPQRLDGAYAWRRFMEAGVRLALGSDVPVEPVDPRLGLYAAVTRQDLAGRPPGGWLPGQRLSLAEALRGFTVDAAYAGFAEAELGRLASGMQADFVLLDRDPAAIEARDLPTLRVLQTWVGGERVFAAE